MGAIAGYFSPTGFDTSEGSKLLSLMLDKLSARAISTRGSITGTHCGLGCIGAKPYRDASGKMAFVIDGKLDDSITTNDLEVLGLANQIEHDAVERFTANYINQGNGFLRDIPNTFALALWDAKKGSLLLAKDHFGTRSLYYTWCDNNKLLLFASEAKALLATGKVACVADAQAVLDILSCGYPMENRTLFRDIKNIAPGTWYCIDINGFSARGRYWSVPYPRLTTPHLPTGFDNEIAPNIPEALQLQLKESVQDIFEYNKNAHLFLSSDPASTNLATILLEERSQLKSISLNFHQESIENLVDHLGLEHAFASFSNITLSKYMNALDGLEAPLIDSQALALIPIVDTCKKNKCNYIMSAAGLDAMLLNPQKRLQAYKGIRYGFGRFLFNWRYRQIKGLSKHLRSLWTYRRAFDRKYGITPSNFMHWGAMSYLSDQALNKDCPVPVGFDRLPQSWTDTTLNLAHPTHRAMMFEQHTSLAANTLPTWEKILGTAGIRHTALYVNPKIAELSSQWPLHTFDNSKNLFDLHTLPPKIQKKLNEKTSNELTWPFSSDTPSWVEKALSQEMIEDIGLFDYRVVKNIQSTISATKRGLTQKYNVRTLRAILGLQLLWQHFGIEKIHWGN